MAFLCPGSSNDNAKSDIPLRTCQAYGPTDADIIRARDFYFAARDDEGYARPSKAQSGFSAEEAAK
jgi:hypothetical protein